MPVNRYDKRLLELQVAAEECISEQDRQMILAELAAMKEAYGEELSPWTGRIRYGSVH